MDTLLLTLGHGSSAIHIKDFYIVAGYEEERFTRHKSESGFPIKSIKKLGLKFYDKIMVSHWDPLCDLNNMTYKHWRPELLPHHSELITLDKDFTHHDAHHMSARAFKGSTTEGYWCIVADGFGNFGETLSIYNPYESLQHRSFGYMSSLGLMYQYATDYLGMKMNQDEFKLLGYEARIGKVDVHTYEPDITSIYDHFIDLINRPKMFRKDDPLLSLTALVETQMYWNDIFDGIGKDRVVLSYVVQSVIERVIIYVIRKFNMVNVLLVGGLFQNVKLNNKVLEDINGLVCVMPLAGDQGAAIGLYRHENPYWVMPNNLYWGRRTLKIVDRERTISFKTMSGLLLILFELLQTDKIVNIVYGSMEFGARALGHTSTLAMPTMENVEYINHINGRDTIMPMGPIMTCEQAESYFENLEYSELSYEYMVIALSYTSRTDKVKGVAHNLPDGGGESGRPQVIFSDHLLYDVVNKLGPLINTSFNIHGVPIVYDSKDIVKCIDYQQKRDTDNRVYTLILLGDNHDIQ